MKKLLPESCFPVGADRKKLLSRYALGLSAASGFSAVVFLARFFTARAELYRTDGSGKRILREGFSMAPFGDRLGVGFAGFAALALALVLFAIFSYGKYYSGGSRSIYLMRRLPDPFEMHRRCLTLPALGLLAAAAAAAVLLWIYYVVYITATPSACLDPGQAEGIWRALCLK